MRVLDAFALLAVAENDPVRAVRLASAAAGTREVSEGFTVPAWSQLMAAAVARARSVMTRERFQSAWAEGQALTMSEATSYALGESRFEDLQPSARPAPLELSRREKEIAELVAQGLANREVATRLFISVRTVEAHLAHIFGKLGLDSRTELAAWWYEHDREAAARIT